VLSTASLVLVNLYLRLYLFVLCLFCIAHSCWWYQQKGKPCVAKRKINFLDNNLAAVELVSPLLTSPGLSVFL